MIIEIYQLDNTKKHIMEHYLFNSINEFVSPEIISTTSSSLKEDKSKVSSAIYTTIASLLEIIVEKKDKKKLESILKRAGHSNTLLNISNLFRGNNVSNVSLIHYLLKDKVGAFKDIVASSSGITKENAKKIVFEVSSLVAAFFGEKLVSGINFSNLTEQLEDERITYQLYIPLEMTEVVESSSSKAFLTQKLWLALL